MRIVAEAPLPLGKHQLASVGDGKALLKLQRQLGQIAGSPAEAFVRDLVGAQRRKPSHSMVTPVGFLMHLRVMFLIVFEVWQGRGLGDGHQGC